MIRSDSSFYRAVWRWHFYAGLLTLPLLVILAITGGLYLFKTEIHQVLYRDMIAITPVTTASALPSEMQRSVESALRGQMLQLTLPARADRSAEALVRLRSGEVRNAYLDPYDAHLLGSTPYGGAMQTVRNLHNLTIVSPWANVLVEIVAGWTVILVLSGVFLWWPKGGPLLALRGGPAQRLFWRDLHAAAGILGGTVVLFLAITGMPWSMFWGQRLQEWVTAEGLGTPTAPAAVTPYFLLGAGGNPAEEHEHALVESLPEKPWALQTSVPPRSPLSNEPVIGIDAAVAIFDSVGMPRPLGVQPPEGPEGAYAASYVPNQADEVRFVYLDQYSGAILDDTGFAQYGAAAKTIQWGIAVHQGQQYGRINQFIMLIGCIAVVMLAVSSVVMWWKRRPRGSVGTPPLPQNRRAALVVMGLMGVGGMVFPLTGISFLLLVIADHLLVARQRR